MCAALGALHRFGAPKGVEGEGRGGLEGSRSRSRMGVGFGTRRLKPSELEAWLGQVMVPVEPRERFARRLRARLIELRGARPARGWVTLLAGVGVVLAAAIWMGAAVRLILAVLTIFGVLANRRLSGRKETSR